MSIQQPGIYLPADSGAAPLEAFYTQDIHAVRLNVDAESLTHAQMLYRRLGFQVLDTYANCEKVLSIE